MLHNCFSRAITSAPHWLWLVRGFLFLQLGLLSLHCHLTGSFSGSGCKIFSVSSSAFLEWERRKLELEWGKLPNPKPAWEEFKRLKLRRTNK